MKNNYFNLIHKIRVLLILVLCSYLVAIQGCDLFDSDDNPVGPSPTLPSAEKQLDNLKNNWTTSALLSSECEVINISSSMLINNQSTRDLVYLKMTDINNLWMMNGDPSSDLELIKLSDNTEMIPNNKYQEYIEFIENQLIIGNNYYEITWEAKDGTIFKTTAITTKDGYVFDCMSSSVFLLEPSLFVNKNESLWHSFFAFVPNNYAAYAAPASSFYDEVYWIFTNIVRGFASASVSADCSPSNDLVCTETCNASMQIGTAEKRCTSSETDDCCYLDYDFALATPLVNVTWNNETFSFECSGIGSRIIWSGSLAECEDCHQGGSGG